MAIEKKEIEDKSEEYKITPQNIEKDYVYGWVLAEIYNDPELKDILILKGGNAFRKAYYENTRFSKDLDFSVQESIDEGYLQDKLNELSKKVTDKTGVKFDLPRTQVREKNLPDKSLDVLEAKLYFKGFYNEEPIYLKTQLDITQFDKIYLPLQTQDLIHPYSDADICSAKVTCQKAEEIIASKLNALLKRRKVCDIFDLLQSLKLVPGMDFSKKEIINTFLKKSIYENAPGDAKRIILDVPLEEYRPFWGDLIVPVAYIFDFENVMSLFSGLIEDLFAQLVTTSSKPRITVSSSGGSYHHTPSYSYTSVGYFPSGIRNSIIEAGRSRRMLWLVYNGIRRLVEPYSIEYYVRESDGVGNEYLWAYDTTGGSSGRVSIKRFFTEKIESASISDHSFYPRFDIEF